MKKAGNFRRLDIPLLLHTTKGLEVVSNFLSTHRIGTRSWVYRSASEDDDPDSRRWDGLEVGWGRLNDDDGLEEEGEE